MVVLVVAYQLYRQLCSNWLLRTEISNIYFNVTCLFATSPPGWFSGVLLLSARLLARFLILAVAF